MNKNNQRYRALLDTGRDLFFKHGTKRVSVEEICASAGVSKMTFYKYFSNKIELAKAVLDEIVEGAIKDYYTILESSSSFEEKIRQVILMKLHYAEQYGKELTEELVSSNEELQNYMMTIAGKYQNLTLEFIQKGKDDGAVNRALPTEFILFMTDYIRIILADENLKALIPDVHKRIEALLHFYFYGIMNNQ